MTNSIHHPSGLCFHESNCICLHSSAGISFCVLHLYRLWMLVLTSKYGHCELQRNNIVKAQIFKIQMAKPADDSNVVTSVLCTQPIDLRHFLLLALHDVMSVRKDVPNMVISGIQLWLWESTILAIYEGQPIKIHEQNWLGSHGRWTDKHMW